MSDTNCSAQKLDKSDSVHHMSHSQARPELPPLPVSANEEPSELYKTVMSHSFYPPLMQRTSWTLAVPFKEQDHHRGPSDSIGNNYSLTARDMKLKDLLKVYQPVTISIPRDKTSQGLPLAFTASKTSTEPSKKKMKFNLKAKDDVTGMPFVCKFSSSLSIKNTTDSSVTHPESRPMSPEQQMDVMLQQEMEIESKEQKPSELDLERYYYYLTNGIRKDMIAPENEEVMMRIYKLIPKTLLTTPALEPLQVSLRSEKESDYYYSLMKSIGCDGAECHPGGAHGATELITWGAERRERTCVCQQASPFGFCSIQASILLDGLYLQPRQVFPSRLMAHMPIISGSIPTDITRSKP